MADKICYQEILQYIQQEWAFMADDSCVPVQVALQLMDPSSLGRAHQYGEFKETHKQLQRALRAIVNGKSFVPIIHVQA
jgi:exocyst complex component 4